MCGAGQPVAEEVRAGGVERRNASDPTAVDVGPERHHLSPGQGRVLHRTRADRGADPETQHSRARGLPAGRSLEGGDRRQPAERLPLDPQL